MACSSFLRNGFPSAASQRPVNWAHLFRRSLMVLSRGEFRFRSFPSWFRYDCRIDPWQLNLQVIASYIWIDLVLAACRLQTGRNSLRMSNKCLSNNSPQRRKRLIPFLHKHRSLAIQTAVSCHLPLLNLRYLSVAREKCGLGDVREREGIEIYIVPTDAYIDLPQQCLNLRPLPQTQGSLRPVFAVIRSASWRAIIASR